MIINVTRYEQYFSWPLPVFVGLIGKKTVSKTNCRTARNLGILLMNSNCFDFFFLQHSSYFCSAIYLPWLALQRESIMSWGMYRVLVGHYKSSWESLPKRLVTWKINVGRVYNISVGLYQFFIRFNLIGRLAKISWNIVHTSIIFHVVRSGNAIFFFGKTVSIYDIDKILRKLSLIKNPCFIRV